MFNQGIFVPSSNMVGGFVGGSGTLNYVAKWTPNGTTIGNSVMYDNGTNVGVSTTAVTAARFNIKGAGATFTTVGFIVKDSADLAYFTIHDNGQVYIQTSADLGAGTGSETIHLYSSTGSAGIFLDGYDAITGTCQINFGYGGVVKARINGVNDGIQINTTGEFRVRNIANSNIFVVDPTSGNSLFTLDPTGLNTASARVHIIGSGATSATYGLKVQDSGSNVNFSVDNSGGVNVGIVTTNAAKLHLFGKDSITGVTQRIEPVGNITQDIIGGGISTINATPGVALSIPVPTDKVIGISVEVVYKKVSGAGAGTAGDGTRILLNSSAKNVAGTVTLDDVNTDYSGTINAIAGVSATLAVSTTNVNVRVTGVANDNITWHVIATVVSSI